MKRIVITGPPFAGKSSVIKELENQGYNVVDESAREILNSLRDLKFIDPHKNKRDYFQREVVFRQIKIEDENRHLPLTFYDRGIVDSIAYYRLDNLEPPKNLLELANIRRYDSIFYFAPLQNIKNGRVIRDENERKELEGLIMETYREFGYNPIYVPELSIKQRVSFILERT